MTDATEKKAPATRKRAGTATPARKKRTRESEVVRGRRSFRRGSEPASSMNEALSDHPLVPKVREISPNMTSRQMRFLRNLSRHLFRDHPWMQNIGRVAVDQRIGTGPVIVSPFDRPNALFRQWCDQIDPRGDYHWGGLHREAYWEFVAVGNAMFRVRSRLDRAGFDDLTVPLQFELLPVEMVAQDFNETIGDLVFRQGIARNKTGKATHYAFYTKHPTETKDVVYGGRPVILRAKEVFHLANRRLGSNFGEVPVAAALMRLIKMSALEDAEVKRKLVSTLFTAFAVRPVDASDDESMLPTEDEVSEMIDEISLTPGGLFELPYGYKIETASPKDEPANYERALKWMLMAACAAVGILPHEVIGEIDIVERLGRYINLIQERQSIIAHEQYTFQVLRPMWKVFIDHIIAAGLWDPPEDLDPARLYEFDVEWDLVPLASFNQELKAMMLAEEGGNISKGYIQKTMFQLDPQKVSLERAREAAREEVMAEMMDRLKDEERVKLEAEMALARA